MAQKLSDVQFDLLFQIFFRKLSSEKSEIPYLQTKNQNFSILTLYSRNF